MPLALWFFLGMLVLAIGWLLYQILYVHKKDAKAIWDWINQDEYDFEDEDDIEEKKTGPGRWLKKALRKVFKKGDF